ncbi:MAG: amidohydrolase family protein [Flammeovirgaceae bacterium]|nr:amidohydrolase family protein [Flammeovirgaceae bacterium]
MMKRTLNRLTIGFIGLLLCAPMLIWSQAQDEKELAPVTRTYAITNVNIVQAPGKKIDMGTVVIKNGIITGVGKGIPIPPEAVVIKADSMYVYAGFIDGLSRAGVPRPKEESSRGDRTNMDPGNPTPEAAGVTPNVDVRTLLKPDDKSVEELRNLGFTVAQVVPYGNLLPGQAAVISLGGGTADQMVIVKNSAFYSELSTARGVYPSTTMGVMAKWRDLYRNASLTKSYEAMYASNRSGLERPVADPILEAFYPVIDQKQTVLFKAEKVLDVHRVYTLKNDLGFPLMLADVKEGWPVISKIKAANTKVFLSLDLPEEKKEEKKDDKKDDKKAEKPKTAADIEKEALEKRKAESIALYVGQASDFQKGGVAFGFSSLSAKAKEIQASIRRMIAAGLSEDAALAALTTTPASFLGLSDRMGTVENGKAANLVISDKSYFDEKAKVRYVFVDGVYYKMDVREAKKSDGKVDIAGSWAYTAETPNGSNTGTMVIKGSAGNFSGTITSSMGNSTADLKSISLDGDNLTVTYDVTMGSNSFPIEFTVVVAGDSFEGSMTAGRFGSFPVTGTKNPKN